MTPDVLVSGLRWTFWVLCYLVAGTCGLLLLVGMTPVPEWLRWTMFAVIVWALAEDARQKIQRRRKVGA